MTEKPGSAVGKRRLGLTATSQVTGHMFGQQETSELGRTHGESRQIEILVGILCISPQDGSKIPLSAFLHQDKATIKVTFID